MKNSGTILLSIALAAVGGLFGLQATGILSSSGEFNGLTQSAYMVGHVTMTVTGPDGLIKSYYQGDNLILDNGENCAAKALFAIGGEDSGADFSAMGCGGALDEGFNYIALGNGSGNVDPVSTDKTLDTEITGNGLARTQGTVTFGTNSSGANAAAIVTIENTFTAAGTSTANGINIDESGLFNVTSGNLDTEGVFAIQAFPSTLNLNNDDSLTVEWQITIGG